MSKVAITDYTFPDLDIERGILEPLGHTVIAGQCKTEADLIGLTRNCDQVITQFAPVNAQVIMAMERARVIVRYGIGVDNVDLACAAARGIPVCNVPDYCIDEVADHTLALLLGLTRGLLPNHRAISKGGWGLAVPLDSMQALCRLTVGVIGFGRIGRAVSSRLRAFGCRLLIFDPALDAESESAALDQIIAESDIVTLHCPSNKDTRRLINAETLARMKRGALLINASRGDLVETAALEEALKSGHLGGAGLDVCDPEPIPAGSALRSLDNVIVSSHVASASPAAVRALREAAASIAALSARGEPLPNVVNGVEFHQSNLAP